MSLSTLEGIIEAKSNWLVSAVALIVRMKNIGMLTEWQYRTLLVEATQKGLRKQEINGIARERSLIIDKLLAVLKSDSVDLNKRSEIISIPLDELANLLFKMALVTGSREGHVSSVRSKPDLKLV